MTYWIIAIIILNLYVLILTNAPPVVKLNAVMVSVIAFVALIRIWQKKRERAMEKLADELKQLQKENEELKKFVEKVEED
ncbi:hypothetical protein DRQ29_03705 [bacterium]|nr:MAG: hypothetical protein DRQ29_03705 [bacterium]